MKEPPLHSRPDSLKAPVIHKRGDINVALQINHLTFIRLNRLNKYLFHNTLLPDSSA